MSQELYVRSIDDLDGIYSDLNNTIARELNDSRANKPPMGT